MGFSGTKEAEMSSRMPTNKELGIKPTRRQKAAASAIVERACSASVQVEQLVQQAARVLREDGTAMASQLIIGWGEVHSLKSWEVLVIADRALDAVLPDAPSYITVDTAKNRSICEDFSKIAAAKRLGKDHIVLPAREYLERFNRGEFRGR